MRRQTKSMLEEITGFNPERDNSLLIESRASHIINSAINLLQLIRENYPSERADELERRLLNSIKSQDPAKFSRGLRKLKDQ